MAWALASTALGGASLIVPLYVVELGGTAYTLGVMAAMAAFLGVPGALVAGPFADRSGRHRSVVILTFSTIAFALIAIPLVESAAAIIVINGLIWLAFAAAIPVLTLLAVADVPESEWSARIALLNKYQGGGWAAGLALGALISIIGSYWLDPQSVQRLLLVSYALIAGGGILGAVRWVPRATAIEPHPDSRRVRRAIARATRFNVRGVTFPLTPGRLDVRDLHPRVFVDRFTPPLGLYFIALFLGFAGFAAFFAPLPAYLSDAPFTNGEIFGLYVISSLAAAVCFGWAGRLATARGGFRVHLTGLAIRACSFPVVTIVVSVFGITVFGLAGIGLLFVLIGVSWAFIIVTAGVLVTQLSPPTIRGEALGLYSALMAFAGGVGAIVGGRLALHGYLVAFAAAGGLVVAGGVVTLIVASWHGQWLPAEGRPMDPIPVTPVDDRP